MLFLSSLLFSGCTKEAAKEMTKKIEAKEEGFVYASNIKKDFRSPDIRFEDNEEDEDQIGEVDVIKLHYLNDDNNCKERAFYVWVNGVGGKEYSSREDGDIVKYAEDGSSMTITIDFNDPRFVELDGATSLMYIIKYKMKSPTDLNWGGQSEDVELKYVDFPPVEGKIEVWCTPAPGGGIAQFGSEQEAKVDGVNLAYFIDFKTIKCKLTSTSTTVDWQLYAFDETYYKVKSKDRDNIKKNYLVKSGSSSDKEFIIPLKYNAHLNIVYAIISIDQTSVTGLTKTVFVSFEQLYFTSRFEEQYTYRGNDLGMTYSKSETTFKVWSPVAANVTLLVYNSNTSSAYMGDDKYVGYHMLYQPNGVWAITLIGDLEGKYYNYQVDTWVGNSIAMDPYATGCGACGLRAMIYDKTSAQVTPTNWNSVPVRWDGVDGLDIKTPQELAVYEVHVQDFTGDESWVSNTNTSRGTFKAFIEEGTTYTGNDINGVEKTVSTGFDHLKELGINAVQLMPVFDADNDEVKSKSYNWGYNPQNYNCVEGAYSSNPNDGRRRILEYKELVLKLAQNGMRVIMDVVYNHVSSVSSSPFNKLMPRYFFRYAQEGDEDVKKGWITPGELYDGSGCHNEFRSEATMARKYIVDSVSMWAKDYKIKGFRFDLMGLIDVETMRAVKRALFNIDPDIYLYGEGWTSGGFHGKWDAENSRWSQGAFCCNGLGNQVYSALYNGNHAGNTGYDINIDDTNSCYLGGFNDLGRNSVRGGNDAGWGSSSHLPGYGWISQGSDHASYNNRKAIEQLIWGGHANGENTVGLNPKQTVNYASCHDNWTLRDQLYYCLGDGSNAGNGYDVMHASETVHALMFASNAAAFMLGGEEILRTKDDDFMQDEWTEKQREDFMPTYENMYGHLVSHNSYNSPLRTNSFKWGQKIVTEFDYKKGQEKYKVDSSEMTEMFAKMIALHKALPKYNYENGLLERYQHTTSAGLNVDSLSWSGSKGDVSFGIQLDEYFIYASGRDYDEVSAPSIGKWGEPILQVGGNYSFSGGKACLGSGSYNTGFSLVMFCAGGKR